METKTEKASGPRRDFGSFHSSNVEELLDISQEDYEAPSCPIELHQFSNDVTLGHNLKKTHFYLEAGCTFLNHAAFGAVLKQALQDSQRWQVYIERQPLRFYDRELLPQMVDVTRRLATFVCCDHKDLILVPNVTTAVNTIINSQSLQHGDIIYCLSFTYGAVKKILNKACIESGTILQEELVAIPTDAVQIIKLVEKTLKAGTKLAVFDHIPSNMPFILPVEKLVDICHSRNVPVLIDGAHALGFLPLDIQQIGADYYVSNAHKWLCCPKGVGFMYIERQHHQRIKPLIVSHGYGSGFHSQFIWIGLRDYSPFLALKTVLNFWEKSGPTKIREYAYNLIKKAGCMALVQLPEMMFHGCDTVDYSKAEIVQNALYHQYNIEVPIKSIQGKLYVRISAHIYNELQEYEYLADCVLELAEKNILYTE